MHKKIEVELINLAHQILQMKDKSDVIKLKNMAAVIHEKLAVLEFVDNYFLTNQKVEENKVELEEKDNLVVPKVTSEIVEAETDAKILTETKKDNIKIEKQTADTIKAEADQIINKIVNQDTNYLKNDVKDVAPQKESFATSDEFRDSIPADVAANLFEKADKLKQENIQFKKEIAKVEKAIVKPTEKVNVAKKVETIPVSKPKTETSLNDRLLNNKLQVGLNDRIAFVKHLFNYSQEDFNRVLSQLNTFETETEAKDFINNQVKPEYKWAEKQEYETRLLLLIERKFL